MVHPSTATITSQNNADSHGGVVRVLGINLVIYSPFVSMEPLAKS
jgi:hypothetical protein